MPAFYRETVIDGYNLIHKHYKVKGGEPMAAMREQLEMILSRYRQKSRRHVTVVYDGGCGPKPHSSRSGIEVVYSGSFKSADRWIIDHVRSVEPRPGMMLVVTSDREIRRHAVAWGAQCADSERFLEELGALGLIADRQDGSSHKTTNLRLGERPLSDKEVDYWLQLFEKKK